MIVLVTGATAGFGECIARRFVENGHKVIATGRRHERLQALKDELGENVLTAQLDVRNPRGHRRDDGLSACAVARY